MIRRMLLVFPIVLWAMYVTFYAPGPTSAPLGDIGAWFSQNVTDCPGNALGFNKTTGAFVCNTLPNGVPSGSILHITSGTCPAGYTEVAALNGFMLRGTLAANADVGTTSGSDSITPAGTVAWPTAPTNVPTLAMDSYTPAGTNGTGSVSGTGGTEAAHTHSVTAAGTNGTGAVSGTSGTEAVHTHTVTATGTNGTSATTGNCASTAIAAGTGSLTACKTTAPNLSVSAQTFTGSSATTSAGASHSHGAGSYVAAAETFTGSPVTSGAGSSHSHGAGSYVAAGETFTGSPATLTGLIAWPAAKVPAFSGAAFNNRPAYMNVIFCQKD